MPFLAIGAKVASISHAADEGEQVHRLLKTAIAADYGQRQRDVELKTECRRNDQVRA
jgi:hypothetical protein